MSCRRLVTLSVLLIGCARGGGAGSATTTLRAACGDDQRWDGAACVERTAADALDAADEAIKAGDLEAASAASARAAAEPLDHASHVRLWEQRGIALAYAAQLEPTAEEAAGIAAAYQRVLALDPDHHVSCVRPTKATFPFEAARKAAATRVAPELAVTWPRNLRLGEPVPIEIETVADPAGVLHAATLYVRQRGATAWRAADVTLAPPGKYTRVRLPAIDGTAPTTLEVYATALDRAGNETLVWASAARPRDVPLRYDPPTPWHRTWWVWAIAGGVVAAGAGIATYAIVWEPSGTVDGMINRP